MRQAVNISKLGGAYQGFILDIVLLFIYLFRAIMLANFLLPVQLSSNGEGDADEDPNTKGCRSLHKEKSKLMCQPLVNDKVSANILLILWNTFEIFI